MKHKCARIGCYNTCHIPSWKYCSDNCHRLVLNKRALLKLHKKLGKKKS